MGILKSITSTVFRNLMQLIFLAVLTILAVSVLIGFLSSAETISKEEKRISSVSMDADFSIDKSKMILKTQNDKNALSAYFAKELEDKGQLKIREFFDNDVKKEMFLVSKTQILINRFVSKTEYESIKYTYIEKDKGIKEIADLSGYDSSFIKDKKEFLDINGLSHHLTMSEAVALADFLEDGFKQVALINLFNSLKRLSLKYLFTFSYIPSQVFSVKLHSNDKVKGLGIFMRMFPMNTNKNTPYALHLIKGNFPGHLNEKFIRLSHYKKDNNAKNICYALPSIKLRNECGIELKTQIVINQNFAITHNLKIGDTIIVNAVKTKIVGIGETKLVEFPNIMPLFPIPNSKSNGVFWVYDNDPTDSIVDVNHIHLGPTSFTFATGGLFKQDVIYGKFNGVANSEKPLLLKKIESEIHKVLSPISDEPFFFTRNDSRFVNKLNVDTLSSISFGFKALSFTLTSILIFVLILIALLSTKSLIQDTRDRLAIMKVIGYSRGFIIFVYSLIPTLICVFSTICGYFLGLYFNELLLSLIKPSMLNDIQVANISNAVIALIILVPLLALITTTFLTIYFLIKEPASQSLKLHDNKKPSKLYIFCKKFFPLSWRKSKIHISFFISSFGKIITLVTLVTVSTLTIFISTIISQTASDYTANYSNGKNYNSAIFYTSPVWNLPTTRYSLATSKDSTYSLVNLDKIRDTLNNAAKSNDITGMFNDFLNATWLKDSFVSIGLIGGFDHLNYPNISVGGVKFSKEVIKNMICSAALGDKWEFMNKTESTISSCLLTTFTAQVPKYLQERVNIDENYPFSFGRIDFSPDTEELFTWANYEYFSKSKSVNTLKNSSIKLDQGKLIGLGLKQKKVKLFDKNNNDLFQKLQNYWFDNLKNDRNIIPVVVNRTVARKYGVKSGDYLKLDTLRKEFVNTETKQPVYGVIKDYNGNIIKTSGEVIHDNPLAPDGEKYSFYYDKQAKDLEHLTIVSNKGFVGLGWQETSSFSNGVRNGKYRIKIKNDRDGLGNSKVYYIVGVTDNFELNKSVIYTLQGYVNDNLHYPNSLRDGESHLWFNGKFTDNVDGVFDVFRKQSCITQIYGAFAQSSISTHFYDNPITPCVFDVEFKNLVINTIGSLSSTLDIFLYSVLFLFSILNIIVAYIINSVAAKSMKKIIWIMRLLGYKAWRILWTISLSYIPPLLVCIPLTLGILYWLIQEYGHQFLAKNLVDLPINLRWWYFVVSGVAIFLLFIILFLVNFSITLKRITGEKKK